ncbi:MAG: hypothetical protein HEP71_06260 [Roseivirga sp.]|nr:hypothetical protein [Roseivirga sp.]
MKRLAILFTLFIITQAVMGYRYHDPKAGAQHSHRSGDETQTRTWKFEDKSIVAEGTFLMAKAGKVFIEKKDAVISIPIEKLSWVDQKYVSRKLREIETINKEFYLDLPAKKASNASRWAQPLAGTVLALVLLFTIVYAQRKSRGKTNLIDANS